MGHATPMATILMIMMITVTRNDNVHFIVWVFAQSETNKCHIPFEIVFVCFDVLFLSSSKVQKWGKMVHFNIKIYMHHFIVMSLKEREIEKEIGKTRKM